MKRERISEIAELLDKRGKMTFDQLEEYFPNVSQMTLRRDLFQLEEEGKVIRIRGGAMSVREVVILHGGGIVRLALECHLEASEVVEHDNLSREQGFEHEGLDTCQHGLGVGLGHGGGVVDVFGEVLEGVLACLHGRSLEVVHLGVLGVAAFGYFVVDHGK